MKYFVLMLGIAFLLISCVTAPEEQVPQDLTAETPISDSLSDTSDRLVQQLFDNPVEYKLAVLPFDNDGSPEAQDFSLVLQDEIISSVFRTDIRNVVLFERTSLNRIIEEQQLSLSGVIENPVELGKIMSADQIVIGHIQSYGEQIRITARIIDVESGNIMNSVTESIGSERVEKTVATADDWVSEGEYTVNRLEFIIDFSLPEVETAVLIVMKDGYWIEYNNHGDQINKGEYEFRDDRTIGVTWVEAMSEGMIGTTTNYEYSYIDGVFVLRIMIYGDQLIGFIELERR